MPVSDQSNPHHDLSLRYLSAELARLDARLRRAVGQMRAMGEDPAEEMRGLFISDAKAARLLDLTRGLRRAPLPPDEERRISHEEALAAKQLAVIEDIAGRRHHPLRLPQLQHAFGLSDFERDALLIAAAPALDLRYEKLFGYLQDDVTRKRASVSLILDLLCNDDDALRLTRLSCFSDDAPLMRHSLVHIALDSAAAGSPPPTLLGRPLAPDPGVLLWLLGEYRPPQHEDARFAVSTPAATEDDALVAGDAWPEIAALLSADARPPLLALHGPDEDAQRAVARLVAATLGRALLTVTLDQGTQSAGPIVQAGLRDARLLNAIVCVSNVDAGFHDGGLPAHLLAELCAHPGWVIVCGRQAWQPAGIARDRHIVALEFGLPGYLQRKRLWASFLARGEDGAGIPAPSEPPPSASDQGREDGAGQAGPPAVDSLDALAGQFNLTTAQIRDAVASARDGARRRATAGAPVVITPDDLFASARMHTHGRLGSLARKITPRYAWGDIVLPHEQIEMLQELVAMVRGRALVLGEWGLGRKLTSSAGVTALFAGPPGTGKTMAAEVIASELGLDLYKIDLSGLVSKYIGETEKNLERIFAEAESSNAILFFDEADSIFGKRSEVKDAHDRYANIEVSYLLQRMEAYDGVTILATNLRANLDDAFTRRLQFAIDFPFPDDAYRLQIWQTLFPHNVPRGEDVNLAALARRHKLAGGAIRNIIVSACYKAASDDGVVRMKHLQHGVRREMQKMGRLIE